MTIAAQHAKATSSPSREPATVADFDQTADEACAELEADGVDVDGFLRRVRQEIALTARDAILTNSAIVALVHRATDGDLDASDGIVVLALVLRWAALAGEQRRARELVSREPAPERERLVEAVLLARENGCHTASADPTVDGCASLAGEEFDENACDCWMRTIIDLCQALDAHDRATGAPKEPT